MSAVTKMIFKEARKENMPLSAPGVVLFSLESSIPDKLNKNKAYHYKRPYFTEARLLTHDQLDRINKIISEKHEIISEQKPIKKEVSVLDMSTIDSPWLRSEKIKTLWDSKPKPSEKFQDQSEEKSEMKTETKKSKRSKKKSQEKQSEEKQSEQVQPEMKSEEKTENEKLSELKQEEIKIENEWLNENTFEQSKTNHSEKRVQKKMTKQDKLNKHKLMK